jgi:hypothetical protein
MPNTGKRTVQKDMAECVQLHFNIYKERGVKVDKEHWYQHVPKGVETSLEG